MPKPVSQFDIHAEQIRLWLKEGVSRAEMARRLGKPVRSLGYYIDRLMKAVPDSPSIFDAPSKKGVSSRFTETEGEASLVADRVTTLDDLIAACDIDLEVWEVGSYQCKVWEMGRKAKSSTMSFVDGVITGESEDSGKIYVQPLYSVAAKFSKRVEKTHDELADHLRQVLADMPAPSRIPSPKVSKTAEDTLEVMMPDLHFGRLANNDQTESGDYCMARAEKLFKTALYNLVSQAGKNIKTICLPIGNDYFNVDNLHGTTTKGTRQDEEAAYFKSFTWGWKMLAEVIETLSQRYYVDVLIIPGNHDTERSYYLGEVLGARFRSYDTVTVDNAPTTRKYRLHGCTLVGYSHGDKEPPKDLPMLMAQQRPSLWAKSLFREWHQGHLHHRRDNEIQGVFIRTFPSLAAPCAWSAGKGYVMATRQACAIEYTSEGPVRQYNWFVLTGQTESDG